MTRQELKFRAKERLGNNIFDHNWLMALVVVLIFGAITGVISTIPGIGAVASILVTGPITYGVLRLFLKQARDGMEMNIADMFCGFQDCFADSFLIGLLTALFSVLWSLLFVVPGIIKYYSYSMAYYIKADNPELTANQCIKASMALMEGHKMDLFILDLSFIGWYIVGSLCLGVGTLWVAPYHQATRAQFYESIKAPAVTAE